jgi:long-chain fatty acid transport protein
MITRHVEKGTLLSLLTRGSRIVALIQAVLLLCAPCEAQDAGGPSADVFVGAPAMGQAMVMTTKSSLLSTSFNPAGLAELDGTRVTVGLSPGAVSLERIGPGSADTDRFTKVLVLTPNFAVGSRLRTERFYFGLAMTAASGFGTDWNPMGPSRYFSTDSQIGTLRVNPTVAFKPRSRVSLGLGLDYIIGVADLHSQLNVTVLNAALGGDFVPDPDGAATLDLKGTYWGYNAGLLLHVTEQHHLGAFYRSRLPTMYKGTLEFSGLKDQSAGLLGGATYSTLVETVVPFPEVVSFGYTFQPTSKLDLNFTGQWANWSVFKNQKLDFVQETDPIRLAVLNTGNPIPRQWKDVHTYGVGTEYQIRDGLRVRGGTYFASSPVPDSTFEPSAPFLDRIGVAFGVGRDWGKTITIDAGFIAALHKSRQINNDIGAPITSADGRYGTFFGVFGLNVTYRR